MDNETMVKNIRELCFKNNISISQLENDLNFGAGLISRWNKSSPSIDKIFDIAEYFRVSLDDVIGHQNIINDKFLSKLIYQTVNKNIKWESYNNSKENQPKKYCEPNDFDDFTDQYDYMHYCETHKERSYFTQINNSFISIYGCYEYQNIINPAIIKLFIQPDNNAELVEQSYDYKQLKVLWLKVLYVLGDNAPDEIKAEEFKNYFINAYNPNPHKGSNVTRKVLQPVNASQTLQGAKQKYLDDNKK